MEAARGADWRFIVLACVLVFIDRVLMAYRWLTLLAPLHPDTRPPFGAVMRMFFVSTFLGTFLPASVGGDAVRAYGLSREGVGGVDAVASVLMDRLLGVVSILDRRDRRRHARARSHRHPRAVSGTRHPDARVFRCARGRVQPARGRRRGRCACALPAGPGDGRQACRRDSAICHAAPPDGQRAALLHCRAGAARAADLLPRRRTGSCRCRSASISRSCRLFC